ncbi:DUF4430 domain-containing protein [Leptospira levettii]|uniref:DUF4430 domain-containing protein n=1 Tax=Leptospira levettii TaxID=2023178 RepID=UPI001FEDCDA2|nr:DUF4430 domain-containing protein [Leptospira levettii]
MNHFKKMTKQFLYTIHLSLFLGLFFFTIANCKLTRSSQKPKEPEIQIQFLSKDYEETKSIPSSLFDRKDLLVLLAELSKNEDPAMRFISTNRTEEIMEVNGIRNSWDAGWVVYVNGERIDSLQMKKGVKVGPNDQIQIRFETVERVFGRPIN